MKKIEINTFTRYQFLSEVQISPNGQHTAFVVSQMDLDNNQYQANIHLLDNQSRNSMRLTSLGDAKSFVWSKDNKVLFSAVRESKYKKKLETGEEITCYYEISPTGGEAALAFTIPLKVTKLIPLTEELFALTATCDYTRPDLSLMDQAQRASALSQHKSKTHVVFDELPFWANGKGIVNKKRSRLYLYNRRTDTLTALTARLFEVAAVSASDRYLLYSGVEYDTVKSIQPGLYLYDLKEGSTKELIAPNTTKLGTFDILGDSAILCLSDGVPYGVNQFPHFYKMDLRTGEYQLLAQNDASVGGSSVGSDSRLGGGISFKVQGDRLYYTTTLLNHSYLRYIDLSGHISPTLTSPGSVDCFDIVGDQILYIGMKGNRLAELYLLEGGTETRLTSLNEQIIEEYSVVTPEPMSYISSDGLEIYGWVMKPVGYTAGKKYPAILNIHGGPRTVYSDVFFHEMQVWANDGYFVFYSNPRGSDGRGNEFGDINGKYGTVDYVNVMEFTDKVLELYPDIDTKRIGVTGGSYGGYMTNWIIGHTKRFKAACAQRSISNWITYEGTSDIGYYFTEDMLSATTHTNLEAVWEASPIKHAMNAETPTLYIQSQEDYRCWMGDSLQMFNLLKRRGIDSRYVLFYGDNHELSRSGSPKNRVTRLEEIGGWFDKYLK